MALAAKLGLFAAYDENRLKVNAVFRTMGQSAPNVIKPFWNEALAFGETTGCRNSQLSVLAPTGTISFMMDCDTTGIEPDIALVKYKRLAGGGTLKMVNRTVAAALLKLGYTPEETNEIVSYIEKNGFAENAPLLKREHLPVFDCAFATALSLGLQYGVPLHCYITQLQSDI